MLRKCLAASALAILAAHPAWAATDTFDLDATHTYPSFEINHLGFSVMRGAFTATTGTLSYDQQAHTGSIKATIDVASIATGFAKRDEHLRSKDFFNVEKFPTMTFAADNFTLQADKPVTVAGSLTLLGVTKPVSLSVQATQCGKRMGQDYVCGAMVSTTIKRSDWGMNTYVPYIGDDVKIQVEVEAIKKP
jgi:polyisoprenoid-binding protein YceI